MKKIKITIIVMLLVQFINAQTEISDIVGSVTPNSMITNSSFQLGTDLNGYIQNTVNESTGKVVFSVPITTISASSAISHAVSLDYNGEDVFDVGQNTNEFNPTSTVGVGFSISVPKIVSDYKQTTAKDDDDYYLIFGNTFKLKCIKRTSTLMEFVSEPYNAWKISYHIASEHWVVINDSGTVYQYGDDISDKAKVFVSTWGNWIGDSIETPLGHMPTEWSLVSINDQWNNKIVFDYESIEGKQNTSQTSNFHTEAIYLKEVSASNGYKLRITYKEKLPNEYFEPHRESDEPDAFQEKYEKKYVDNFKQYNSYNELVTTTQLEYQLVDSEDPIDIPFHLKRYLNKITVKTSKGESLPPKEFLYHTEGEFKGGIDKRIFVTGGFVKYNYKKQKLFTNTENLLKNSLLDSNTNFAKSYHTENYILRLQSMGEADGKNHRIVRYDWKGDGWEIDTFYITDPLLYGQPNYRIIAKDNFYSFLYFNKELGTGNLYLFHLAEDGVTWKETIINNIKVESDSEDENNLYKSEPVLISGDKFIAIGTNKTGRLHTYVLENDQWTYKQFLHNRDHGRFYFTALENYVLVFDEDPENDVGGESELLDNMYIHYLNNELEWNRKSGKKDVHNSNYSHLFYGNTTSIVNIVGSRHGRSITEWDENYNLVNFNIDFNFNNYISSVDVSSNGMYSFGGVTNGFDERYVFSKYIYNGINWITYQYSPDIKKQYVEADNNIVDYSDGTTLWSMYNGHCDGCETKTPLYFSYNPNVNTWSRDLISGAGSTIYGYGMFRNYFFIGNKVYKKKISNGLIKYTDTGIRFSSHFFGKNKFEANRNYAFGYYYSGLQGITSHFSYINKQNGKFSLIEFDNHFGKAGYTDVLYKSSQFLGSKSVHTHNSNGGSELLYRIIDDRLLNDVTDNVLSYIEINDGISEHRKIEYDFGNYRCLSNEMVFYGKTILENKGYGSAANGKIVKYFDPGVNDMRLLGQLNKIEILDVDENPKKETVLKPEVLLKNYISSTGKSIHSSYLRTTEVIEKNYIEASLI